MYQFFTSRDVILSYGSRALFLVVSLSSLVLVTILAMFSLYFASVLLRFSYELPGSVQMLGLVQVYLAWFEATSSRRIASYTSILRLVFAFWAGEIFSAPALRRSFVRVALAQLFVDHWVPPAPNIGSSFSKQRLQESVFGALYQEQDSSTQVAY